jgi:hypothetical protein
MSIRSSLALPPTAAQSPPPRRSRSSLVRRPVNPKACFARSGGIHSDLVSSRVGNATPDRRSPTVPLLALGLSEHAHGKKLVLENAPFGSWITWSARRWA